MINSVLLHAIKQSYTIYEMEINQQENVTYFYKYMRLIASKEIHSNIWRDSMASFSLRASFCNNEVIPNTPNGTHCRYFITRHATTALVLFRKNEKLLFFKGIERTSTKFKNIHCCKVVCRNPEHSGKAACLHPYATNEKF